jgi:hypothetical protein
MSPCTVANVTLDVATKYLQGIGYEYSLPTLNAINYDNNPHQYNLAYKDNHPVGMLITTTKTNDIVFIAVAEESYYLEVGKALLHATQVKQVLIRKEETEYAKLLDFAGYTLTEDLVKFKLYRKSFLIQ